MSIPLHRRATAAARIGRHVGATVLTLATPVLWGGVPAVPVPGLRPMLVCLARPVAHHAAGEVVRVDATSPLEEDLLVLGLRLDASWRMAAPVAARTSAGAPTWTCVEQWGHRGAVEDTPGAPSTGTLPV